jgi:hypothetical protein
MKLQDILHGLLVLGLAGTALEAKLQNVVTAKTFTVLDLIFAGALIFTYYADVIFVKKQDITPTPPQS